MTKFFMTIAVVIGVMVAGSATDRAKAMPLGDPSGMGTAVDDLNIIDKVQFFWGEREYCWYDDGWHGPGWYWCDNYLTPGIGWGGGYGWHGWRGGHRGERREHRRRDGGKQPSGGLKSKAGVKSFKSSGGSGVKSFRSSGGGGLKSSGGGKGGGGGGGGGGKGGGKGHR